jgi:hypothetical protein
MDLHVFRYLPLLFFGVLGCTSVQYTTTSDCGSLPSDTFWSGNVALQCQEYRRLQAETAYREELTRQLAGYRECLKKHETSPTDAKEQCSLYLQAFRETSPPQRPSK